MQVPEYEQSAVLGCFSSLEKAKEAAALKGVKVWRLDRFGEWFTPGSEGYVIREYELDSLEFLQD